jgi:hypothetical protein
MHVGLLQVDLPESSYLLTDQFLAREGFKYMLALHFKNMLALHFSLECNLRAGKKTHCYRWLLDSREPTGESVVEPRRH